MATPTPARALLRQTSRLTSLPIRAPSRCISTTPRRRDNRVPRYTGVGPLPEYRKPHEQGSKRVAVPQEQLQSAKESFPQYTEEELRFLSRKYTPEQIEAIKAGEGAIEPQDLMDQGVVRNDYMSVDYLDDFSRIHPVLDKKRQPPSSHEDPNLRYKTDEELQEDLARWVDGLPDDGKVTQMDWDKFDKSHRVMVGKEEAEKQPIDYLAPELPKMTDPVMKRVSKKEEKDYPMKREYEMLQKQTGLSIEYMRGLRTKIMSRHRVVNQTRMGKIDSQYFLVIAGNGNGLIGIGEGKHDEAAVAIGQATMKAIRNMIPIPRYENRTVYGDLRGKVSGTVVELYNRPPGFGVRCQERIYEVAKCCGISDLSARTLRSSNPMNTIKATVQALTKQRIPEVVARGRGRKLVDVRKVYYAGNT